MNAAPHATIRLGVIQTPGTRLGRWRETRSLIESLIARAARAGAELALLPECVWPAYYIESVESYLRARTAGLPGPDEFLGWIRAAARRDNIAVCAGYVAERDGALSNEVALVDAAGELLGTHAKCFLWDFDNEFFRPGNCLQPIATPWGPIGLMICADARLPEIPATLVARGARLLLQPTAWVNVGTPESPWNPQPFDMIPARAREFGVPIASASKWGAEGPTTFVGMSLICDAEGRGLERCGAGKTEVIVAEVALGETRGVAITAVERTRLLSPATARPPRADVPSLDVVRLRRDWKRPALAPERLEPGRDVADNPLLIIADAASEPRSHADTRLILTGPSDEILELRGIRIASLSSADAQRFAPLRIRAMDGVHAAVVFGGGIGADTLRTRAAENRIFIVHVAAVRTAAYSPLGIAVESRLSSSGESPRVVAYHCDTPLAANKDFAPGTNPFQQRRPAMYDFRQRSF